MIFIGSTKLKDVLIGNVSQDKVYVGTQQVWPQRYEDLSNKVTIESLCTECAQTNGMWISDDGKYFYYGFNDIIYIEFLGINYDISSSVSTFTTSVGGGNGMNAITFSPNGEYMYTSRGSELFAFEMTNVNFRPDLGARAMGAKRGDRYNTGFYIDQDGLNGVLNRLSVDVNILYYQNQLHDYNFPVDRRFRLDTPQLESTNYWVSPNNTDNFNTNVHHCTGTHHYFGGTVSGRLYIEHYRTTSPYTYQNIYYIESVTLDPPIVNFPYVFDDICNIQVSSNGLYLYVHYVYYSQSTSRNNWYHLYVQYKLPNPFSLY